MHWHWRNILKRTHLIQSLRAMNNKSDPMKLKIFCNAKDTLNWKRRKSTEYKKILQTIHQIVF